MADERTSTLTVTQAAGNIRVGDTFTIAGVMKPDPDRRWWQFWKPRLLRDTLQTFVVRG